MRNILDKNVVDNNKVHILCSINFSKNYTLYDIMPKNIVMTEGPQIMSKYGAYALQLDWQS